jgi:hypothetical protein
MTEVRQPRPVLASVICVYEALIVLFGVLGFITSHLLRSASASAAAVQTSALSLVLPWIGYALALGIAVTLWQMRREAFYLAAARFGLGLLELAYFFIHPVHIAPIARPGGGPPINAQGFVVVGILIDVFFLAISAAITFYIQHITKPIYIAEPPL